MTPEERRTPYPAPAGYHWEPGSPMLSPGWATFYLVEDGRHVSRLGHYEPYDRGKRKVPNPPVPRWHAPIEKPSQTYKRTRDLVRDVEETERRQAEIERLRQQYRT